MVCGLGGEWSLLPSLHFAFVLLCLFCKKKFLEDLLCYPADHTNIQDVHIQLCALYFFYNTMSAANM